MVLKLDYKVIYKDLLISRKLEEKSASLYSQGLIKGFCHLYIGQEAIAVGIKHILKPQDALITTYRDHIIAYISGIQPKNILAELLGRANGATKAKGGSMHFYNKAKNFYGGHGIVGATGPLATGIAMAQQYKNDGGVTYGFYGDGAANQGQIGEAMNIAKLNNYPVIFVIENNQYGMGTSVARASANPDFNDRGKPYNIPVTSVDGMNIMEVIEKVGDVAETVRSGGGPHILNMSTYRYRGHSMSDPSKYRDKSEVKDMQEHHDVIVSFENYVLKKKLLKDTELAEIKSEAVAIVNEAVEFAKNDDWPDPDSIYDHVFYYSEGEN